ncbi:DNA primase small subunit PriS [Labeo rohita]|uniref:DNA primase small subunit PriS n=1 Tax=Labeo rohita TaxID=84645 RepID=A0ABQ8MX30_LABRO|nr:DNA primase small subunit PriS [Labeo rohita]
MTYPALSLYVDKPVCADINRMLFDFVETYETLSKKSVVINKEAKSKKY